MLGAKPGITNIKQEDITWLRININCLTSITMCEHL